MEHHLYCILNLFSFNLYPKVEREDAQIEFRTIDLLCIICGGGFESFVRIISPTLILVLVYSNKKKQSGNK